MEQNKDQSSAVLALPSDLTEREEIDLLCQVETYMSVTDKHSQTHPEAEAEEVRIYSLVNRLIAKRFSDIGAAVRGEAVAECREDGRCQYAIDHGAEGMGHCPAGKCCMPVSARAADAPSEPSEPPRLDTEESREYLVTFMEQHFTDTTFHRYIRGQIGGSGPLAGDFAWQMARALRRIEAGVVKSRAADALDSQPTADALDAARYRWLRDRENNLDAVADGDSMLFGVSLDHMIDAQISTSSQPTDGGVSNG